MAPLLISRKTVAATFEQLKSKLDAACESLRGFTLGRDGFTQKGAQREIMIVENLIDKLGKIPTSEMGGRSSTTLIALSRGRIKAAEAAPPSPFGFVFQRSKPIRNRASPGADESGDLLSHFGYLAEVASRGVRIVADRSCDKRQDRLNDFL